MKKVIFAAVATVFLNLAAVPSYAADSHESHHAGTDVQKSYAAKGEVVSVEPDTGKAKIRHEAIPELSWPGMTMVFPVANKDLLMGVKAGDKIEFTLAKNPVSGQYTIQTLQSVQ